VRREGTEYRLMPLCVPSAVARATRLAGLRKSAVPVLAALPLLLGCGCSTFSRDWKQAAQQPTPPDALAGRWEGQWLSEVNKHRGRLRCLIALAGENRCAARFQATYARVFRFTYTVTLRLQPHDGGWEFTGDENLGRLAGGVYHYEGRASPTKFFSTYRSGGDHGVLEMHRPE
jgi:hypothetical protein